MIILLLSVLFIKDIMEDQALVDEHISDGEVEENFFQDVDTLQNHGIVS